MGTWLAGDVACDLRCRSAGLTGMDCGGHPMALPVIMAYCHHGPSQAGWSDGGGTWPQGGSKEGERQHPPDEPLGNNLSAESRRFNEILTAMVNIKTTLEPKINDLQIDMGLMREDHKKSMSSP
ncbi:hypothetical protein NDU88_001429 [Pleurodeles waltl]|uniref:Uncharacterized protein n=1 Tax=Pleurodeles waltl TaxID=8319 RepID=A0AAV7U7X3_PLEWA|nr:hypothetical protein NDU88_001429 [Pleurodeles waltl]